MHDRNNQISTTLFLSCKKTVHEDRFDFRQSKYLQYLMQKVSTPMDSSFRSMAWLREMVALYELLPYLFGFTSLTMPLIVAYPLPSES